MTRTARIAGVAIAVPLLLTACGGGGGSSSSSAPATPPAVATFQSKVGTSFAAYFDTASTTADASVKDPTAADVPPLSLTTEPLDN